MFSFFWPLEEKNLAAASSFIPEPVQIFTFFPSSIFLMEILLGYILFLFPLGICFSNILNFDFRELEHCPMYHS